MTLNWVADKMGYTESGISRILMGSRNPTLQWMEKVHEVFDWPVEDQVRDLEGYRKRLKIVLEHRYELWQFPDSTGYQCYSCGEWVFGPSPCLECRLDAVSTYK